MDKIIVPASITLEKSNSIKKYKWLSNPKKESLYHRISKRAFIRFSCRNFSEKLKKVPIEKRQIYLNFLDDFSIEIKRTKKRNISLQGYSGKHPYIQFIVNNALRPKFRKILEEMESKSKTFPINVLLNLEEWKDLKVLTSDFLIEVEKDAKTLVELALKKGFKVERASKGRSYDLSLISPKGEEIIIAISSHVAKTQSRSKEKTVQKILMDISKMLPRIYDNKKIIPVVITRPIKFENSWSFTTDKYLDFYKDKFGFRFLTTDFKKGWEDNIIKELLKI